MMRAKEVCAVCTVFFFLLTCLRSAQGADTVETWDIGATDVDFYLGGDGLALGKYEKTVYGDIMLGYGFVDRFSGYLGCTLLANEYLADGSANLYLGLFGTPLETDHVDLDLFLDVSGGGAGFSEFALSPALELNVDLDPEMRTFGLYLRAGLPLFGRDVSSADDAGSAFEVAVDVETTLGAYYTVADGHQLLVEYDMGFHPTPEDEQAGVEVGGVALGYNVGLHDAIEMIHQVYLDIPAAEESFSVGIMVGIIVTLPTV